LLQQVFDRWRIITPVVGPANYDLDRFCQLLRLRRRFYAPNELR
jgi:hypothetical protein